jgi:hypothetical protein
MPTPPKTAMNSFTSWSNLIRGALIWYGYADPCEVMTDTAAISSEDAKRTELLAAWHAVWGCNYAWRASQIMSHAELDPNDAPSEEDARLVRALRAVGMVGGRMDQDRLVNYMRYKVKGAPVNIGVSGVDNMVTLVTHGENPVRWGLEPWKR